MRADRPGHSSQGSHCVPLHNYSYKVRMTSGQTDPSDGQPQRPTNDDPASWRAYWQELDQLWRTEPEIDEERQQELASRHITQVGDSTSSTPSRTQS
jgi:hypothetical protein